MGFQVAMVNGSRRFDGHTVHFHQFLRGLDAVGVGYQVYTCVDPTYRDEYPNEGEIVRGMRFPGVGPIEMGLNRLLPVFVRRLKSVAADLVHVNDVYLAPLARYRDDVVVTLADVAKLTTHWYPWPSSLLHNLNLRAVLRARGIVCTTEYVRQEILRHLDVPPERVRVVPLYSLLVPGQLRDPPPPTAVHPWNLLYVAADRPHKNLRLFFEILRSAGENYRGTLVSRVSEKTVRLIHSLGLQRRLTILHDVPDLRSVYQGADVFVFPSLFEGFGIPIVEAMSQGLPVIASRVTAIPEVVGDGGVLVDPEDLQKWLLALEWLSDSSFYREQSRRALERAQAFSAGRTGASLLEAYEAFTMETARSQEPVKPWRTPRIARYSS